MKKIVLCIALALNIYNPAFAQSGIKAGAKNYNDLAFVDVIAVYEKVAADGYESADLFQKLADSYYFNGDYANAAKYYQKLLVLDANQAPEYFYRNAITLKSLGEYEKSDAMMQTFAQKTAQDSRAKLYINNEDYLEEIKNNSGRFTIENANINSKYSDYGTAFYQDQIVFTTARDTGSLVKRVHTWTGEPFTVLHQATLAEDGSVSNPKKFAKQVNSIFHESTPVFTKDGKTMYFTRNNYINGKTRKNQDKVVMLKVYKATLVDNKWKNITELPFNSNEYNVAHPALSLDEKTLYFASDMPGTLGSSDLFKVAIHEDGTFGEPENLGPAINTEARETFPFVSQNNELYFASDGHPGLGGLDIFVAFPDAKGNFKYVQNIGAPANSEMDDFSYAILSDRKIGFLSSNREGGFGNDDIYKFTENTPLKNKNVVAVHGKLIDSFTQKPIANATVTVYDENFENPIAVTTDANGMYFIPLLETNTKYFFKDEKEAYQTNETAMVFLPTEQDVVTQNVYLDPVKKPIKQGDDLAKVFEIEIIYFDLDKANIRPDAAVDLAKVVEVMKEYPTMKVDIRSHTDSRATKTYNQKLSDRRAKATRAWMIEQGIEPARLTAKGYGESQLVNKCADGVSCSEAEHQKNRRSEFIITSL
ncbi:OmpA family protein [Flavobacterium agricola]|uniref:OmpA family protein n=1 Tax=Flavobacterium agricola TaxID=2870839 RepID=A0ABY6M043_9FLAO|nr:OmpA family protein [Flavobacterium agricola]UYW01924.1 OmpA family protein [Flavobacterium agricola]